MEAAKIERCSELLCRTRAKVANLQLPELVAARLRRPGDVAVRLGLDGRLVDCVRLAHVVDDLIAAPSHVVDAGVDDQPNGAEKFRAQTAVVGAGILVKA